MENPCVALRRDNSTAIIEIDNPPVNAASAAVRSGIVDAMKEATADPAITSIVIACMGRTFIAGADITEFDKPPMEPNLNAVNAVIESSTKPVVAAIHGTALGGGLEVALSSHYRIANAGAKMGLPEVKLGLVPGAGGTQRLPRLIGPVAALKIIVTGNPIGAKEALASGLIDEIADGDLTEAAIAYARKMAASGEPPRVVSALDDKLEETRRNMGPFEEAVAALTARTRGLIAPGACVECVRNAMNMSFEDGLVAERDTFIELKEGTQSKAQRHLFFAERAALKVDGVDKTTKSLPINRVAILGAGTMGGGIAMNFANAGIPVTIIDLDQDALDKGLGIIKANYDRTAARGGLTAEQVDQRFGAITGTTNFEAVADADMVIEAVFENMDLKKKIFADLDRLCKDGAILASNTSTLDVDEIASATKRPESVLGMHFFSPANVMRLLEIVRAEKTAPEVLKTAIDIGRKINKMPVTVGVCYGFVGNRMLHARGLQVEALMLGGASPAELDQSLTSFGFPMGPCAMGDLAGLDVGWRIRQESGVSAPIADAICEMGRFGQKTGAGYFLYDKGSRKPVPDPEIDLLVKKIAGDLGIEQREIDQQEIFERLIYPMINEGAKILDEGIAARSSDIDLVWINGYGWPIGEGGPMFYGDRIGAKTIRDRLNHYADMLGEDAMRPCDLLNRLADSGGTFAGFSK